MKIPINILSGVACLLIIYGQSTSAQTQISDIRADYRNAGIEVSNPSEHNRLTGYTEMENTVLKELLPYILKEKSIKFVYLLNENASRKSPAHLIELVVRNTNVAAINDQRLLSGQPVLTDDEIKSLKLVRGVVVDPALYRNDIVDFSNYFSAVGKLIQLMDKTGLSYTNVATVLCDKNTKTNCDYDSSALSLLEKNMENLSIISRFSPILRFYRHFDYEETSDNFKRINEIKRSASSIIIRPMSGYDNEVQFLDRDTWEKDISALANIARTDQYLKSIGVDQLRILGLNYDTFRGISVEALEQSLNKAMFIAPVLKRFILANKTLYTNKDHYPKTPTILTIDPKMTGIPSFTVKRDSNGIHFVMDKEAQHKNLISELEQREALVTFIQKAQSNGIAVSIRRLDSDSTHKALLQAKKIDSVWSLILKNKYKEIRLQGYENLYVSNPWFYMSDDYSEEDLRKFLLQRAAFNDLKEKFAQNRIDVYYNEMFYDIKIDDALPLISEVSNAMDAIVKDGQIKGILFQNKPRGKNSNRAEPGSSREVLYIYRDDTAKSIRALIKKTSGTQN